MPALPDATAAWLLDPANPTARRLAVARLGLEDGTDPVAPPIPDEPWVAALLREPPRPGADPTPLHAYQKWAGPHWRLAALAELDVPPSDPAVAPVIAEGWERVVAWLEAPGRLAAAKPVDGRARVHGSQEGLAAWAAIRHGLAGEPGVGRAIERLIEWQWPDGGWNCDVRPEARHSSFHETLPALWGLHEYATTAGGRASHIAVGRAADLLLRHEVLWSRTTGRRVDPSFAVPHYPPYWHYDLLQALLVLQRAGHDDDPRTRRARALLAGRRRGDGTWRAARRWWHPPTGRGSGGEIVDWGEVADRMVTLNALRVGAGR
jgi:hypothetical protein